VAIEIPVLVVSYNDSPSLKKWLRCVKTLKSETVAPIPCIVDNASSDETVGVIWRAIKSGALKEENVLWLPSNFGFAPAQNLLVRLLGARNQYKWFSTLNLDATAKPSWLGALVNEAEKPTRDRVGMWGGLILSPNGRRVSSAGHAFRDNGAFYDIDWNCHPRGKLFSDNETFEPFSPCFAAALWSFSMVGEVGLSDSAQFLYYDDVELAYKGRLRGWRAGFVREAVAYHPVPNTKGTFDQDRREQLRLRGRMRIILCYFPDASARSLFLRMTEKERAVVDAMQSGEKQPFGKSAEREKVYCDWKNQCIRHKP
jgi:GT2 family glycosyltransferase